MRIIKSLTQMKNIIAKAKTHNKKIGFIPTMGAFHEGHLSLMRKCRKENDLVVVSIFINPTQFAPHEDFKAYPRNKKKDLLLAKQENIDIIFYPSIKTMYPLGYLTYISVEKITTVLCGQIRSGHFRGVTTVVGKLLNIISPDTLYLGQKDAQQCIVLKKMIRDLNFSCRVKILPTVRENDGLAMSSRNKYLHPQHRKEATVLYHSLCVAKKAIINGEHHSTRIINLIKRIIQVKKSAFIDYVECVDADSLKQIKSIRGKIIIAIAVRFGTARLIDNIVINTKLLKKRSS